MMMTWDEVSSNFENLSLNWSPSLFSNFAIRHWWVSVFGLEIPIAHVSLGFGRNLVQPQIRLDMIVSQTIAI